MTKPILCVDFDGVIHSYTTPWINEHTIPDPPVPGALLWLHDCTEFFRVVIYSSRSRTAEGRQAMLNWMIDHCSRQFPKDHPMLGSRDKDRMLPIEFAHEKPAAFLTIDDRALLFDGEFSHYRPEVLRGFKPWNKWAKPAT
jgi:hypothetical protein